MRFHACNPIRFMTFAGSRSRAPLLDAVAEIHRKHCAVMRHGDGNCVRMTWGGRCVISSSIPGSGCLTRKLSSRRHPLCRPIQMQASSVSI
jgi:hypothetical protein